MVKSGEEWTHFMIAHGSCVFVCMCFNLKNNPVKYTGGKDYDALEEYVGGALQEEEEDPGEDDL